MVKKPSGNKKRHNHRNFIRKNDKIRAREVRVIGSEGESELIYSNKWYDLGL